MLRAVSSRAVEPWGWGRRYLQIWSKTVSHSTVDCYYLFYRTVRSSVSSMQPLIHHS